MLVSSHRTLSGEARPVVDLGSGGVVVQLGPFQYRTLIWILVQLLILLQFTFHFIECLLAVPARAKLSTRPRIRLAGRPRDQHADADP